MQVLDGYEVEVFPGDKYANAHLFVRATYVHKILVTAREVFLADASMFDGPRTIFTPDEIAELRTLAADLQADEQARLAVKHATQQQRAAWVLAARSAKVSGMETTQIFD